MLNPRTLNISIESKEIQGTGGLSVTAKEGRHIVRIRLKTICKNGLPVALASTCRTVGESWEYDVSRVCFT